MRVVLNVKNVSKSFQKHYVLRNVSFNVYNNEIVGFIGHNGAGKTTTLKIIMDFIKPTSGEVYVFGKENTEPSIKRKLGFLPEHPYFYTNITGKEFLNFVQSITGIRKTHFWSNVALYSKKLSIDWALDRRLSEYSKGMLQRFGILQTIVCEHEFIILDEPMSGLDPIGRKMVMDLMLELKDLGKTILFSTHILSDIERVCDRAIIMVNGQITDELHKNSLNKAEAILIKRIQEENVREVR